MLTVLSIDGNYLEYRSGFLKQEIHHSLTYVRTRSLPSFYSFLSWCDYHLTTYFFFIYLSMKRNRKFFRFFPIRNNSFMLICLSTLIFFIHLPVSFRSYEHFSVVVGFISCQWLSFSILKWTNIYNWALNLRLVENILLSNNRR